MTISRKLNVPVVTVGKAQITLTAKLASRVAGVAMQAGLGLGKTISGMSQSQMIAALNLSQKQQRETGELLDAAELIVRQYEDAARILRGEAATGTGHLVEVALSARALADTALTTDPTFELAELDETATQLARTAKLLREDIDSARRKHADMIGVHQMTVTRGIANPASSPVEILDRFNVPADLAPVLRAQIERGDGPCRNAADDFLKGIAGNDRKSKRARQARAQQQVEAAAAAIWGNKE
ncbi:MAG TPA: hypothetical protein VNQ78_18735 [Paracoccus sp. (in: a-proteobacteria)]|uniref:hypothetical protein n=1 Tax=Paracoccus sp. TaxID=267 RepID=UPI002BC8704D|nr:hypothetical protein [Paracoccus sp. (in: a-proteobacteria)]HWL58694.1 hypothetical protein [Paracoccus sp. (in: a-proteobacteria)]